MDISGTQLSAAILDEVAAQTKVPVPSSQQSPVPNRNQPSTEVTLSRDARERLAQNAVAQQSPAAINASSNPVQPTNESSSSGDDSNEKSAIQAREIESRQQQASSSAKAQENATTYTARVAAQNYVSVSNY